jgi:phosphatidylserine decarboxylase
LLAAGIAVSLLLMLALAIKWKLPRLPTLIGAVVASIAAALPFFWIYPLCGTGLGQMAAVAGQIALSLALGLGLLMSRFWRDPERAPPQEDGIVLSAADGEVLYVRTIDDGSTPLVRKSGRDYLLRELTGTNLLGSAVYVIAVGMSFLDVHVNRCPIAGQVRLSHPIEGKFMSLRKDEAPFVNARLTTILENASLSVAVVQVASRLVRCVESFVTVGQNVGTGQRLGMIRFGSLVAVIVPQIKGVRIVDKPGERVTAGVSVLAYCDVKDTRSEK